MYVYRNRKPEKRSIRSLPGLYNELAIGKVRIVLAFLLHLRMGLTSDVMNIFNKATNDSRVRLNIWILSWKFATFLERTSPESAPL